MDYWIGQYNEQRPHSGRYCYGKPPMQTLIDSKKIVQEKYFSYNARVGQHHSSAYCCLKIHNRQIKSRLLQIKSDRLLALGIGIKDYNIYPPILLTAGRGFISRYRL